MTYDAVKNTLDYQQTDESDIGTHSLSLNAQLNALVTAKFAFNVTISCPDTVFDSKLLTPV